MCRKVATGRMIALTVLIGLCAAGSAAQRTIRLTPKESFEAAAEALRAGDVLVLGAGVYSDSGRIAITVRGTREKPVVIRAAAGAKPKLVRPAGARAQNTINIEGATWLTIRGLEITSNGGDGVNLSKEPAHVTLEDLHIHSVDVGVNFRSDMHHITVRRCHIHDTGANGGTGEGMYVGCNQAKCRVAECVIENNWIHDTRRGTQGDGIEIKKGSWGNVVRDNVIHDTRYPGILVYGTVGRPRNLIEGNLIMRAGDSGIQAAADAIIRNNVILDSRGCGFNSQPHQGVTPRNLEFVHNTIVGAPVALRLRGWDGRPGLVFANNAIYAGIGSKIGGLTGVTFEGNVFQSREPALPAKGWRLGQFPSDFIAARDHDFRPSHRGALVDAATTRHETDRDFDGRRRRGRRAAGAYTITPREAAHWKPGRGFKPGPAKEAR